MEKGEKLHDKEKELSCRERKDYSIYCVSSYSYLSILRMNDFYWPYIMYFN